MSPVVLDEVLVVFVNRLIADGKYPFQDCENLQLPIQIIFSEKEKLFRKFLFNFWIYLKF